jgi:hypothetical protein
MAATEISRAGFSQLQRAGQVPDCELVQPLCKRIAHVRSCIGFYCRFLVG